MGRKKISVDEDLPRQILAILVEAARAAEPCPSDDDTAAQLGVARTTVLTHIQRLERAKIIEVVRQRHRRIVHICGTGMSTAAPPPPSHHRYERAPGPPQRRHFTVVARDPCPRCGVRADIGCRHRPKAAPEDIRI